MTFQQLIAAFAQFWQERGCAITQPFDVEVGAGTMTPDTFLRCLGPEPWRVAYVQPSRRPDDGRYGENPYRLYRHHQYQVMLKPSPDDVQEIYLESLRAIGFDPRRHDIRFLEDDWEAPTLGAAGVGWQVWLDGLEITQFTYFQIAGGRDLSPISVEITYGLERLAMAIQRVDHFQDIRWNETITYGDIYRDFEAQHSRYNYEYADVAGLRQSFEFTEDESRRLVRLGLVFPAYEMALKCSHVFNVLDARGAIGVTERTRFVDRVRSLARACAGAYLQQREELGYPLLREDASAATSA